MDVFEDGTRVDPITGENNSIKEDELVFSSKILMPNKLK